MSQINKIREGLSSLSSAIETIANTNKPDVPEATVNSISGNAIHGGKITLLRSKIGCNVNCKKNISGLGLR